MSHKITSLVVAIAAISSINTAQAAGLDRSTQPSWAFTQDGTFAYVENITIDPTIEGTDSANKLATKSNYQSGKPISDMADDYNFLNFGAKADVNDTISVGAFFDQPWGANVEFHGDNNFVGTPTSVINDIYAKTTKSLQASGVNLNITNANDLQNAISTIQGQVTAGQAQIAAANTQLNQAQAALAANPSQATALNPKIAALQQGIAAGNAKVTAGQSAVRTLSGVKAVTTSLAAVKGNTKVELSSQNFTGMVGVKLGDKKNIQVYGGPTIQKLESDIHLRGDAYKTASGYDANLYQNTGYGWMAGVAYSKPEIALKAALTYRSEIDHDARMSEELPAAGPAGIGTHKITITTPQSVNVDFQTGLNKTTLLNAKLRWVPWGDFAIKPKIYGDKSGTNLVSYSDDAWSGEVGIGKKISPKLALSGSVGFDTGSGNPTTSLGPVEGNWNVGLGAKYNLTPEWAVSAGAKYLMFGDAKAQLPDGSIVGKFSDNDAWVYGLRLSYQKK